MSAIGHAACVNYKQVYEYYLRLAESYRGKGLKILKTDTHNESGLWAHVSLPLAPVLADGNTLTCIEIDENTLNLARRKFPGLDFRFGDIRTWRGQYDIVFDFSTIDHVEHFEPVLQQYRSNAPALSCIVWLSDSVPPRDGQFFFPPHAFRAACAALYGQYEEVLVLKDGPAFLSHFTCIVEKGMSKSRKTASKGRETVAPLLHEALQRALHLHQQGELQRAEPLYRALLDKHPDAAQLLGALCLQQDRNQEAADLLQNALENQRNVATERNLIIAFKRLNQPNLALPLCERLLQDTPEDIWINHNAALFAWELKQWDRCLAYFEQAIRIEPNRADLHSNIGAVLQKLGRLHDATDSLQKSLTLEPERLDAWLNLAVVQSEQHHLDLAAASYTRVLNLDPKAARAHAGLGEIAILRRDYAGALKHFQRALQQVPDLVDALYGMGMAAMGLRQPELAREAFVRCHALAPEHKQVAGHALHAKMLCADWQDLSAMQATMEASLRRGLLCVDPFVLMTVCEDEALLRQGAEQYIAEFYPARPPVTNASRPDPIQRVRVGYVSGEFRQHATSILMIELWEQHRAHVDLVAFDNGHSDASPMRQRIEAAFDEIVPIRHLNDDEAAQAVASRNIDILINLNGFFGHARTGLFARRPAPVQVNYLGFPGTIGAPYIDYIFADAHVIPPASTPYFTEQVIHVGSCYQPRDQRARPKVTVERPETGLPEAAFVYCCFNKTYKITPTLWAVWMRILKQVPDSVLWLLSDTAQTASRLREAASEQGVAPQRLHFAERWPHERHLARHGLADLFLDTVPCNAHTTAADALLTGLPVLTCEGKTFAGRVASSLLHHHDLSHWIAPNLERYEALAIDAAGRLRTRLAEDSRSLQSMRQEDYSAYFTALRRVHAMGEKRTRENPAEQSATAVRA